MGPLKWRRARCAACASSSPSSSDVERGTDKDAFMLNLTVQTLTWSGVTIKTSDFAKGKKPHVLVDDAQGAVEAGQICAIMGPSGCGKTTLLDVLASRTAHGKSVKADIHINGTKAADSDFRLVCRFVEQQEVLLGSLTVRETLDFSSRLASVTSTEDRGRRVASLIASFGLGKSADSLVGTPLRKGISGGQKRRLGVACQLITSPKILFLDEPTSGLDSLASWEVMHYLQSMARRHRLLIILSIHQPSSAIFRLLDQVLLLSAGRTCFFGPPDDAIAHFGRVGLRVPDHENPADFLLGQLNVDFCEDEKSGQKRIDKLCKAWKTSESLKTLQATIRDAGDAKGEKLQASSADQRPSALGQVLTILRRNWIKSRRDIFAYGIRLAIYVCLTLLIGTVWLRLEPTQSSIQPFINALYFGSAFMSFMAVAYVPAFLEDYFYYKTEYENGLCSAGPFILANFIVGLPYLAIFSVIYAAIMYWLVNLQPTVPAFFNFILWILLNLVASESQVVLAAVLFPSYVATLAFIALLSGLWMCVSGFMVPQPSLNNFYKYAFHYWDFQKYVFEGLMVNEFGSRNYSCDPSCHCIYTSPLAAQCKISGQAVLNSYGFFEKHASRSVSITIAIILGYRVMAWLVIRAKC